MVARAVRRVTRLPIDVHLMVQEPDRFLEAFAEAGATMMSVHVETTVHLQRTIAAIKALGCRAGAVLNPATPVVALEEIAGDLDYVLVMSVNPGFGGQTFLPRSESKVRAVRMLLDAQGSGATIEIDGGIDTRTAGRVVAAGARILVAGVAIFAHPDPEAATRELRAAAAARLMA
jgi:ribulose-phosphate 3-epimerase